MKNIRIIVIYLLTCQQVLAQSDNDCQAFEEYTSTKENIFKGCFSPNGNSFYFFKKVGKGETYRIFVSHLQNGDWTDPDTLFLGESPSDLYPVITPDGNYLVFTSYRTVEHEKNSYIWISKRTSQGWSAPRFLDQLNQENKYHSNTYFSTDGSLIYRVTESDWTTSTTYVAEFKEGSFSEPKLYHRVEQWKDWRKDISLWGGAPGPDDSTVILDISMIDQAGKKSKSDQWISKRNSEGTWSEPQPLPDCVNKPDSWDTHIFYSADRKTMYFVRDFNSMFFLPVTAF